MDEEKKKEFDQQENSENDLELTSDEKEEKKDYPKDKITEKSDLVKKKPSIKLISIIGVSVVAVVTVVSLALSGIFTHTHEFGEWSEVVSPKCEVIGRSERVCECGEVETKDIMALGHTDGDWITDSNATCTENGSKNQICSVCNATLKTEILAAFGHTDGEWITDSDASCTENGSKHQVCSVCNATLKTEILAAFGHTDGEWITDSKATCTTNGSKHQVCSVCNATLKTGILTAFGHTDGDWITDSNATCTTNGSKHQVCSVCNATIKTETLTAFGHTDGDWITDNDATCTVNGSKHQVCYVCNATIMTEIIAASGHSVGEWVTSKEATCTENGIKYSTCSRCFESITQSISQKAHSYKGTTCEVCNSKRLVYNFYWNDSYDQTYNGHRLITIAVGEEYQLKYSADITDSLFYDLSNFVFYEPYVVDTPSVISIDENGVIKGLKTGLVGIKNTGAVISGSNNYDDRRIYIQVISEYTETEFNDTIQWANEIKSGQTIKFMLSNTSDVDVFKFTAPSSYVKIICTYHGDYDGAPSGKARLAYVQVLNSNGTLMNSGTNSHDSAGNVHERTAYIDTSTGYIIFKFNQGYSGLFPSGYFTIEVVPL